MPAHGFLGRQGQVVPHHKFRQLGISAALLSNAAGISHSILGDLTEHHLALFATDTNRYRMSGPDIGSRGHGSEIGRQGNQCAGRGRAGAAWVDIDDHRDIRAEQSLDNGAHGTVEAAGGIEFQQKGVQSSLIGIVQLRDDKLRHRQIYDVCYPHRPDTRYDWLLRPYPQSPNAGNQHQRHACHDDKLLYLHRNKINRRHFPVNCPRPGQNKFNEVLALRV